MHPTLRSRRRVGVPLRPKVPLSYDRLGDAVLVRRARDGGVRTAECYAHRGRPALRELLEAGSAA